MERESYCKDGITKTREFSSRTTRKLGSSKEINGNRKKSYEKAVWQEKKESKRTKGWVQCVAEDQKYQFKLTLKKARPEEIQRSFRISKNIAQRAF